jgi:23S rRNA (uracil1939-C5)-methyltransferase
MPRLAIAFQRGYNDYEGANSFIKAALGIAPDASSNPATLARDLKLFHEGGYSLCSIQPKDLFPQTLHVETVVLMSCKDK